jgi:hypothetical protein
MMPMPLRQPSRPINGSSRPPEVNSLDHAIACQNGSTSVLDLSSRRLQPLKSEPKLNLVTRVEQLTKETGYLRQEIKFYRQCFGDSQQLRESSFDVYQQLFLASASSLSPEHLQKLVAQLHNALKKSVRMEVKAEKEWKEFWGLKCSFDELRGGQAI